MIKNARKNRSLLDNNDEAETILIHKDLLEEINSLMTQKSKEADLWVKHSDKGKYSISTQMFSKVGS